LDLVATLQAWVQGFVAATMDASPSINMMSMTTTKVIITRKANDHP
jgi:hypothetical protein